MVTMYVKTNVIRFIEQGVDKMDNSTFLDSRVGCIYLITNIVNGKKYVGQHNEPTPDHRFNVHKCRARNGGKGCPVLYDAIRLHGEENFTIETLWSGPLSELNKKEEYYADLQKSYVHSDPPGYNVAHCGNQPGLGRIVSDEEKAAFGERMRALPRTDAHCARIGVGVAAYIAANPEKQAEKAKKISETLLARGPTGPQSKECVQKKIEAAATRTDNIPKSSGERQIWYDRNAWQLTVDNTFKRYTARFSSKERAIAARDAFNSTGHRTPTDFPKKVSEYGPMIRNIKGKFMVDIHSKRFPEPYAKVFSALEEAVAARDTFLARFP